MNTSVQHLSANNNNNNSTHHISYLESNAIQNTTQLSYQRAFTSFVQDCITNNITMVTDTDHDNALTDYLNRLYNQYHNNHKSGLALATHTISAFCHFLPQYGNVIQRARRALKGYKKLKPPVSHAALPWPAAVMISIVTACHGRPDISVGILLQFDCYLRVGELCQLTLHDILTPSDTRYYQPSVYNTGSPFRHKHTTTVTIRSSKTGPYQSVVVNDKRIQKLLHYWLSVQQQRNNIRLFTFNPKTYNKAIQTACTYLGIHHIHYTSHSIRHGGASYDLQRYGIASMVHIQHRGRWTTDDSVRLYTTGAARAAESAPLTLEVLRDFNDYKDVYHRVIIEVIRSRSGAPTLGA